MAKDTVALVGGWAFIIGVILAVIAGFMQLGTWGVTALIVLGLIVGFLNVTEKETTTFILTTVGLVIVANFAGSMLGAVAIVGGYLEGIFSAIIAFITPATIVVGLKAIYSMARDA